jgi:hypothetical protein
MRGFKARSASALDDLFRLMAQEQDQQRRGGSMVIKAIQGFVRLVSALTLKWEAEGRHYATQARYYEASAEQTEISNRERAEAANKKRVSKDGGGA